MFLSIVTKTSNFIFCQRNQLTVLFPAESGLLNGLALVSGLDEKILRSSGQALVQEQFHFQSGRQTDPGCFQSSDGISAAHAGKILQEFA